MQRKKLLIGAGLFLLAFLIAILSVDFSRYSPQLVSMIANQARGSGVGLRFTNPAFSGLNFTAGTADIYLERVRTNVQISSFSLNLKALPLLWLDLMSDLSGSLYGGTLSADTEFSPLRQSGKGSLTLSKAQINQHPYGALFQINGDVNLTAKNIEFDKSGVTDGEITLEVRNGHKDSGSSFNLKPFGINFSIQIPKFSDLTVSAHSLVKPNLVRLTLTEFSSSLFGLKGDGQLHRADDGTIERIQWEGSGTISPEGSKVFGGFLPLISQGRLTAESTSFGIRVSGSARKPNFELLGG